MVVTLYSLSTCKRCCLIRQMLQINNVEFTEIIDNQLIMKEKNIENTPTLEVDGIIIDSYVSILKWLRKNNYYSLDMVYGGIEND